jgi:hypothetical protein
MPEALSSPALSHVLKIVAVDRLRLDQDLYRVSQPIGFGNRCFLFLTNRSHHYSIFLRECT